MRTLFAWLQSWFIHGVDVPPDALEVETLAPKERVSLPPTVYDEFDEPMTDEEWKEAIDDAQKRTPGGVRDIPLRGNQD